MNHSIDSFYGCPKRWFRNQNIRKKSIRVALKGLSDIMSPEQLENQSIMPRKGYKVFNLEIGTKIMAYRILKLIHRYYAAKKYDP